MKSLRKIIRESIEKLYTEMFAKPHFLHRVYDRLKSDSTTFKDEKKHVQDILFKNIDFLKDVDIETQDNIAFLLLKGPNRYIYHNDLGAGGKIEHAEGSFIWAVTRGNELETIIFKDAGAVPQNTQTHLTVDRLRDYIFNEKGGNMKITDKDIARLKAPKKPSPSEAPKKEEIIINMLGTKWVLDPQKEVVFKRNKPSEVVGVWDLLEDKIEGYSIDDQTRDLILSYLM